MDRDLVVRRLAIERLRSSLGSAGQGRQESDIVVSPVIRASWQRCALGVAPAGVTAAPVDPAEDTRERWDASPIRRAMPALAGQLQDMAIGSDLIVSINDQEGRLLWGWTPRWLREKAEQVGLVPGGIWNETTTGTSGIATALAADVAVSVFSTEHWLAPLRDWVCYAAPVHAPDGSQLGALNLSTRWEHANPLGLSTVATFARLVELELQDVARARALTVGGPTLSLRVLGRPRATVSDRALGPSLRHLEILTILATVGSATLDEMHALLYGDRPVRTTTLKSEISHLRHALGGRIASRPYRLTLPCAMDAMQLLGRLEVGDVEGASELYRGQLLPMSDAPLVVERRHHLDVALRTALLRDGSASALLRYAEVHPHDVAIAQQAVAKAETEPGDVVLPMAMARLAAGGLDD